MIYLKTSDGQRVSTFKKSHGLVLWRFCLKKAGWGPADEAPIPPDGVDQHPIPSMLMIFLVFSLCQCTVSMLRVKTRMLGKNRKSKSNIRHSLNQTLLNNNNSKWKSLCFLMMGRLITASLELYLCLMGFFLLHNLLVKN